MSEAPAALGTDRGYCFRFDNGSIAAAAKKWHLQDAARHLLPDEKQLGHCHKTIARRSDGVEIWASEKGAYFHGLVQCGSVWLCPVCSEKISQVRGRELQQAIDNAMDYGHGVQLVTLTVRHGRDLALKDLLTSFTKAVRRLKSGRAYEKLLKDFGILGEVRALEVTHGEANGWHPHTHALTFSHGPLPVYGKARLSSTDRRRSLTRLRRRLFVLWYRACSKEGLPLPSYRRGVDVRPAKYAADYVAKFGFAAELVKTMRKKGREGRRNQWKMLADAAAGDKRAAWLFREYAGNFKGRRQLFWSRGLREKLSLDEELTEQQAMDLHDDDAEMLFLVDPDTWAVVLRANARASVLVAAREGMATLYGLLNRLRCEVPLWDGSFLGNNPRWEI